MACLDTDAAEPRAPVAGPVVMLRHRFPDPRPVLDLSGVQGSPDWLKRDGLIGASVFPTVLRCFRHNDLAEMLLAMAADARTRMAGRSALLIPRRAFPEEGPTPPMQKGSATERDVLRLVHADVGLPVLPGQVFFAPAPYNFIRVSLDGEVATSSTRVLVEAKSMMEPPYGGVFPDIPALYRILQCQLQCAVTGAEFCVLAVAYLDSPEWEEQAVRAPVTGLWPRGRGAAVVKLCRGWAQFRDSIDAPTSVHELYTIKADKAFGQLLFALLGRLHEIAMRVANDDLPATVEAVNAAVDVVMTPTTMGALASAEKTCTRGISLELKPHLASSNLDTDVVYVPVLGV